MKVASIANTQTNFQAKKKSNVGAKIGAAVGFTTASTAFYLNRNNLEKAIIKGLGKKIEKIVTKKNLNELQTKKLYAMAKNVPLGATVIVGALIGALAGKGIQKLVNHFSK